MLPQDHCLAIHHPDVYAYITHQLCHFHTLRCSFRDVLLLTFIVVSVDCCNKSMHVCVQLRHVCQSACVTSALQREPLIVQEAQFAGTHPG